MSKWISLVLFVIVVAAAFPKHKKDELQCSWRSGGLVSDCYLMAMQLPNPHKVPAMEYVSGGTFILNNAQCVEPQATFAFHAAYYEDKKGTHISDPGNYVIHRTLEQWPDLLKYLDSRRAFQTTKLTKLTAVEVAMYGGPPLCR